MKGTEFTGKTVEEAIETGLKELNLTKEQAEIKVVEDAGKGLFKKTKAKVVIAKKQSDGERALNFIEELIEKMNFCATAELTGEDDKITINLITTNSSSIIGYRGEVLDALQCLAGAVANTGREEYKRVVVDCENYREKREETLKNLANRLAAKAIEKGRKVTLEPMNPYERRIIHAALADNTEVKTLSDGKEPNRYISIIPNNMKKFSSSDRNGGYRKDFNNDRGKKNYRNSENRGFRPEGRERGERSGGFSKPSPRKAPTTFGTYLGNSQNKE